MNKWMTDFFASEIAAELAAKGTGVRVTTPKNKHCWKGFVRRSREEREADVADIDE